MDSQQIQWKLDYIPSNKLIARRTATIANTLAAVAADEEDANVLQEVAGARRAALEEAEAAGLSADQINQAADALRRVWSD